MTGTGSVSLSVTEQVIHNKLIHVITKKALALGDDQEMPQADPNVCCTLGGDPVADLLEESCSPSGLEIASIDGADFRCTGPGVASLTLLLLSHPELHTVNDATLEWKQDLVLVNK